MWKSRSSNQRQTLSLNPIAGPASDRRLGKKELTRAKNVPLSNVIGERKLMTSNLDPQNFLYVRRKTFILIFKRIYQEVIMNDRE
jgi:hypothetical protein